MSLFSTQGNYFSAEVLNQLGSVSWIGGSMDSALGWVIESVGFVVSTIKPKWNLNMS